MTTANYSDATILKALVGSRAHGLHKEDSDWDWRGVWVQPTKEILSMGYAPRTIQWIEGKEDFTNYEIGHFLSLAAKANPSVLELLRSPQTECPEVNGKKWGEQLVMLMPYIIDPQAAFYAFTGYSLNQRKKLLEDKDGRKWKYATAYIRTLYNLEDLLTYGDFSLLVKDESRIKVLKSIRDGGQSPGEIIDLATCLTDRSKMLLPNAKNRQDLVKVNNFLLDVRKAFWGNA